MSEYSRSLQVLFNLKKKNQTCPLNFTRPGRKKKGVTLFLSSSCFFFCSFSFSFIFSAIFFFSETFGSVKHRTMELWRGLLIIFFFSNYRNTNQRESHGAQLLESEHRVKRHALSKTKPTLFGKWFCFFRYTQDKTSVCSDAAYRATYSFQVLPCFISVSFTSSSSSSSSQLSYKISFN